MENGADEHMGELITILVLGFAALFALAMIGGVVGTCLDCASGVQNIENELDPKRWDHLREPR
jgi:hypothetical protein